MALPIILIIIAAFCKAVAETLAWHFDTSIFRNLNRDFWEVNTARIRRVKRIFNYPVDGWHIANSIQLLCWLLLPLVYRTVINQWVDFAIGAALFIVVFNILFNKTLKK